METKSQVHNVEVELSVILGCCTLPMHQLLKMGRGAVIQLRQGADDQVWTWSSRRSALASAHISVSRSLNTQLRLSNHRAR